MLVLPGGCRRCVGVSPTPVPVSALRPSAGFCLTVKSSGPAPAPVRGPRHAPGLALAGTTPVPTARSWPDALAERSRAPLEFDPMPSSVPLWVLFSSGTTGCPRVG
jgi:hypothetical protein